MKNWAGNVVWNPTEIAYPKSENEISKLVLRAANDGGKIRLIGSGHSFSPVCETNDILMSLDEMQGLVRVDKDNMLATVKAGTKLKTLGAILFEHGMAMENLGDIDVQSVAGAISTGTHGTGSSFGTISTQLRAIRFVNGKGEIQNCSPTENPSLFKAMQISLGALGVITELTIQCVPLYKLGLDVRSEKIGEVMPRLQEHLDNNRNYEFYWFPYSDVLSTKTSNVVETSEVDKIGFLNYWSDYILENYAFKVLCEWARMFPSQNKAISRLTAKLAPTSSQVQHSHKVYATPRLVKFTEMEYNIPAEAFPEVFKEITKKVNNGNFNVHFPIENRWVKKDDIYLSPAYGRDSAYIACHVYNVKEYRPYFKALEEIFQAHGGRPHWGKMNTIGGANLPSLYPEYEVFMKHRKEQDPAEVFLSPYMKKLLTN